MSRILDLMQSAGAVQEGHFQLTSGQHSNVYIEKFRLLERPDTVEEIGQMMADLFKKANIDVVMGAAVGGILVSHATARALRKRSIFAERVDGRLTLRRGFDLKAAEKVLVVEDIVTTGGSVRELLRIVEEQGGDVVGVACLVDRSQAGVDFGYPTESLLRYPSTSWQPDSCPLCREDISLTTPGRSAKK